MMSYSTPLVMPNDQMQENVIVHKDTIMAYLE